MNKVSIIGSGFSSLSSACYLAKSGFEVTVYEKNSSIGGRARVFEKDGFKFDMGPSWYWMPDVLERFFEDFGKKVDEYYELIKLNPAYRVFFSDFTSIDIPDRLEAIYEVFEKEEAGSAKELKKFLAKAEYNYEVAIKDLVYRPGLSPLELITPQTIKNLNQFFTSVSSYVRKRFKSKKLIKLLEFPVLFLGAKPQDTPSFYSFMNYADFVLGTWYPKGGMYKIIEGMERLALELGVQIHLNSPVEKIITQSGRCMGISVKGEDIFSDIVLSGADYAHTETLLKPKDRAYKPSFWDKQIFAPSALIFYIGIDKKLKNIPHHLLFFDTEFDQHAQEIYDRPSWPKAPLFYANFPSTTDPEAAPEGKESGFFLIPLAPDLEDTPEIRDTYFDKIILRLEQHTKQDVRNHIILKESYCVKDFKSDYNSYKGNAY
jgi:phytoene desaturase